MKCPNCGKKTASTDYCDQCGVLLSSAVEQDKAEKHHRGMLKGGRNAFLAAILSFILPGLGQIYGSDYKKAVLILFGTIIGLWVFFIPGVLIWLYGIYDAFSTANKMNNQEIGYREANSIIFAGFIIFGIVSVILVSIVIYFSVYPALFQLISPTPSLKIISATYGVGDKKIDVTTWLNSKIINNAIKTPVTNTNIGSDPAYGFQKFLIVKYEYQGQEKTANITESKMLILP